MTEVNSTAAEGFAVAAEAYVRARPGYPPELVHWLLRQLGVTPGATVVDLGAGTGKLTGELVAAGATVIAVEPVAAMRAALARAAPAASLVAASAQFLPLADGVVDAVMAAQAFHWFATEPALDEIARVLRPGCGLGLVWNRRALDDPLQAAIDALIAPHRSSTPAHEAGGWREVFDGAEAPFVLAEERSVRWNHELDADGVIDRVASISFVALLPSGERDELLAQVKALVSGGRSPSLVYDCQATVCRRR